MEIELGAIPLSADILAQSNIGLWAFELDEGLPPRMYADSAMLKLLGLQKQLPPEEIYHAWYDNIDPLHYDEVHATVDKMTSGIRTEVQYPWHSPDGKIVIVRCGGVRNFKYTKGIRIEGVHQDVTHLIHHEKELDEELARKTILLEHEKFRTDALTFLADMEPEPEDFINFFAERFLKLSGCDQVIFTGSDGNKIQKNQKGISNISESICKNCPYSKFDDDVYNADLIEITSVKNYDSSIPEKCPVKSSYINVVKVNGIIYGYLALHYIRDEHLLAKAERKTLNLFSSMLSLALNNINVRKNREKFQKERLLTASNIIDTFCKDYTTVLAVNIEDDTYKMIKINPEISNRYAGCGEHFSKVLKNYVKAEVSKLDQNTLLSLSDYKAVAKKLISNGTYDIEYRAGKSENLKWHKMSISSMPSGNEFLIGIVEKDEEILLDHIENVFEEGYFGIYVVDLVNDKVKEIRKSEYYPIPVNTDCYSKVLMEFTKGLKEEDVQFFKKLSDVKFIQNACIDESYHEYIYYSHRTKSWVKLSTYVLSRNEKNLPLTIAHCFSNVDSIQKTNIELNIDLKQKVEEIKERQTKLEETLLFTNYFLSSYGTALYVNLMDLTAKVYKRTSEITEDDVFSKNYYEVLSKRIDKAVLLSDREVLREKLNPEYLYKALKKENEVKFVFTDVSFEKPKKFLFHAIRGADAQHAAIGFREITSELEKERTYVNTIMNLFDNFEAIYNCDVNSGKYTVYSENNEFADNVISAMVNNNDFFKDIVSNIENCVYKDDRKLISSIFNRENIKKLLQTNSVASTEYRLIIGNEPKWYKLKVVKSSQQKNHFLVGVFNVNQNFVKEKELTHIVNGLTTEFVSLLHVDIQSGNFKVYRLAENEDVKQLVNNCGFNYQVLVKIYSENFVHPDDRELFMKNTQLDEVRRLLIRKKAVHMFYRCLCGKGYRWYEQVIVKVKDTNGPLNDFIIYHNDRDKEVREEQNNKRKLEEALGMAQSANRAKTTFLNNMSHDIRTPMNAIIGYTDLAKNHIDNKEQVKDYLSKIGQSSDHLLSLINDVLDMSRIESGKMNLTEKKESLSDIVHTLRDIVQADIKAKQLEFHIDTCDIYDEDIICDRLRLNQVLLNILSNAIKYSVNGGSVNMCITESNPTSNGCALYEFVVKDTGIGMSEEFLKTIFDPFTRMKSSTVSGIQGTGLGMAITKNIVDMMGGKIEVKSELNKGTEVKVGFNFKLQKHSSEPVKIAELQGLKGLVVDDNSNTCASISSMLRDVGMRSDWCTTGKEAVFRTELAQKDGEPFKVYIIDWLMPDMNGIEIARRIRKLVGNEIPIIIVTAYDWSDIEEEAMQAGVTAFVRKPLFPSDLRKVLNQSLGKEKKSLKKEKIKRINLSGKKVLLVDDNEYNREIAVEILKECNIQVRTAKDGIEAVEIMLAAKKGDFDLILMDIQMPVLNGYEATKQIRALKSDVSKIPILAMTANAFDEDKKLAFDAGMNEHITKPIKVEVLQEILAKYI